MQFSLKDVVRFHVKVDRSGGPTACWPWLAEVTPGPQGGYGRFGLNGRLVYAHRVAYVLAYGPIPDGLTIDHVKAWGCTRRDCCNPTHLEAVTHRTNVLRGDAAGAIAARKTHCPKGHPYVPGNLTTWPARRGVRACATCKRLSNREYDRMHRRPWEVIEGVP